MRPACDPLNRNRAEAKESKVVRGALFEVEAPAV
jgi:hypothetical protein